MECKDCYYKKNIGNTEETGHAICTFSNSYEPINIDNDCMFGGSEESLGYAVDITAEIKGVLGDIVKRATAMETPDLKSRDEMEGPLISEENSDIVVRSHWSNAAVTVEFTNGSSMDISASDWLYVVFNRNLI